QRVPVSLRPEWSVVETPVDWKAVGTITEVVVLVRRTGDAETAAGTVYLDLRFERLSLLRKLSTSPGARAGGVLLLASLAALLTALLRALAGPRREREPTGGAEEAPPDTDRPGQSWHDGLGRDFVLGSGSVFIAALAVGIYLLGARGPLEVGWTALGVAAAGAALAEWLKFGLTGKHLTAGE